MNNIKRFLSVILAVCMAASVFTVPVLAQTEQTSAEDENYIYQKQLLNELGILNFDIETPDAAMSRAQFVDMAIRTYIEDLSSVDAAHTFSDVIPNYEYKDAIEAAYGSGVIKGSGDGIFGVNDNITPKAAVTIMLRILGCEQYIAWQGSFDDNYLTTASRIGLTKNVDLSQEGLSFKEAVQLVYNAIGIAPFTVSSMEAGSASFDKDKDSTLISERIGIDELDGTVTDNQFASLMGVKGTEKGYVKIDGELYKTGSTNADDFIGYDVHVYCKKLGGDTIPTILHIEDDNSLVTYIDDESYAGFSNGTLSYYKRKNSKSTKSTLKIEPTALILYNGALVSGGDYSSSLFNITNGSITVVEKSLNNLTVVNIKSYKDLVFDRAADMGDYTLLVDKFEPSKNVVIDDIDMFDIRDTAGIKMDVSTIAEGSTVSAAVSLDGSCGSLVVSTNMLKQAYVTAAGSDGVTVKTYDEPKHTYDETEYKYSSDFKELNKEKNLVKSASEYTIYINASGDIAYMDVEKDVSDFYAYIIGYESKSKGLEDKIKIKVFKDDGKTAEYTFADNVKIDGVNCKDKSNDEICALLGFDSEQKSKLVYLSLNYDSTVRQIDTCLESTEEREADYSLYKVGREAEDTLYKIDAKMPPAGTYVTYPDNYKYYSSPPNVFNSGIFVSSSTKIMAIPLDSNDEKRFKILTTSSFINGRFYITEGYARDDEAVAPDVIIYRYYSRYSDEDRVAFGAAELARRPFDRISDTDTAFVSKLSKGTDPNTGESVDILTLTILRTGAQAVHYIDDSSLIAGISQGDLVRWYTLGGTLCYLEKLYDVKNKAVNPDSRPLKWSSGAVAAASFYIKNDGNLLADSDSDTNPPTYALSHSVVVNSDATHLNYVTYDNYENGKISQEYWKKCSCTSTKVYKYDERNNSLEKVDLKSVVSFNDGVLNNSEVIIVEKTLAAQAIIIY